MKITEYQKVTSLAPNDIMLIDGAGGTRTIEPKDAIAPQLAALKSEIKSEIGDDISDLDAAKADVNGYYSLMTTGRAENLLDTRATGVARNFVFDTTAGTDSVEDVGTAEIKSIHGKTLVWNQLYSTTKLATASYTTYEVDANGVVTVRSINDLTAGKYIKVATPIAGHKYYVSAELCDVNTNGSVYIGIIKANGASDGKVPSENYSGTDWLKSSGILTSSIDTNQIALRIINAAASGTSAKFRNIIVCDLTSMFGAGNEPATAADFEAMFPRTDYAYDAGSLINFNGTGIKTVGFNLLDISTGKANIPAGNAQITGTFTALTAPDGTSVTPDEGGYFTSVGGEYTTTGADDTTCVHLVWSGYRDDEYEDYWTRTLDLPIATYFPDGMRSVYTTFDELTADKAIKRIGSRAYADGDENDPTVLTDGSETLYTLAEPVVTEFETPLNLTYQVDDFGTEQLLPENDDELATSPFSGVVAYSTDFTRQITNMPKNYTSQSTLDELLAAIGTAIGGTFTKTWDSTNGKWTFTFEEGAAE